MPTLFPIYLILLVFILAIMPTAIGFDTTEVDDAGNLCLQSAAEFMLTFDDGPLPGATERVLDALAELRTSDGKPVKAGFFLVGDVVDDLWQRRSYYSLYEIWADKGSIAKYPQIAQRIKQAGHTIGNHTAHHAWFRWPWLGTPEVVLSELSQWEAAAKPVFGALFPRLFRPPYLIDSEVVREASQQSDYQIVLGKTLGDTLPGVTVAQLQARAKSILEAWNEPYPCVLIFHDIVPVTYGHLGEIVRYLQQQGFRLVHFDPERL